MQPSSDFELVQKRFKERQQTRNFLVLWGVGFVGDVALWLIFPESALFWVMLGLLTGVMAASKALQLYTTSPKGTPREKVTEQEMNWMFGADWRNATGSQEYNFAQDRIRKRRFDKLGFILHFVIFLP